MQRRTSIKDKDKITFYSPPGTKEWLFDLADKKYMSLSELMNIILRKYKKEKELTEN